MQDIKAQHESEKNQVYFILFYLTVKHPCQIFQAYAGKQLTGRHTLSLHPPAAERAEQNAVVRVRPPGPQPEAAAGAGETAAGEGADNQGPAGAG